MDCTLAQWWAMGDDERAVVVDWVHERVPAGFVDPRAVGHARAALPQFIHQGLNVLFHVVFGGEALIGMSDARFQRVRRVVVADDEDLMVPVARREEAAALEPARRAPIPTCLVADEPLAFGQYLKLGVSEARLSTRGVSPVGLGGLLKALTAQGWRVPCEAEWEYACRAVADEAGAAAPPDAPTGRLFDTGLRRMGAWVELCSDDWHDDYTGAPATAAWGSGHEVLRGDGPGRRFTGWDAWAAWTEAVWPGRRRLASWPRSIAVRPWLTLPR